ncbi:MAG: alpha/beta hydrolase [Polyangiaceae bacterium]
MKLAGWYAHGKNGAAVVLVHGAWSNRVAMLPEATELAAHGYGVLLFDSRADGNSEGDTCTWGDRERDDVVAGVDFVAAQPDVRRIGAVGFSVGAYSVSGAAARDPRIGAMILEAATPSLREAEDWDHRPYGALLTYPTELMYRWQGGLRIPEINVVAALKSMIPRPVLIVVGSLDPFVLPWMTDEVVAAAPPAKALYVVPGAGHGGYAKAAGAAYLSRLTSFFDEALR